MSFEGFFALIFFEWPKKPKLRGTALWVEVAWNENGWLFRLDDRHMRSSMTSDLKVPPESETDSIQDMEENQGMFLSLLFLIKFMFFPFDFYVDD